LRCRCLFPQQAGGLDAIAAGHAQVHQDDVRLQAGGQRGGARDLDIWQ
jgi:hypothetical protein